MTHARTQHSFTAILSAGLLSMMLPAAVRADNLVNYIPDDVFVFQSGRHNSEREFLENYWQEVFDALSESGIITDATTMFDSYLPEEAKTEGTRIKDMVMRLIDGVDWSALVEGETAWAMRPPELTRVGTNFSILPPDQIVVFQGRPDSAEKNFKGLVAILETFGKEINGRIGFDLLAVKTETTGETCCSSLQVQDPAIGEKVAIGIARHQDKIIISVGQSLLKDTLKLINGDRSVRSLSTNSKFKNAFSELPEAEDMQCFVNIQLMVSKMRSIADDVFVSFAPGKKSDYFAHARDSEEALALNRKAIAAYSAKDYKQALAHVEEAHEIAPDNSLIMYNIACFSALLGEKDKALTWLVKAVDGGCNAPNQISTDADLESLRGDARYKEALAKATANAPASMGGSGEWVDVAKPLVHRLLDIPTMFDYSATVQYTDGYSVHTRTMTALSPNAKQKPFYKVLASKTPISDFKKYLPQETKSFAVSSAIDCKALYHFVLDTVRSMGPKGEGWLAQWAAMQEQFGFNVEKDFLDWFQGDSINVTLDLNGQEQTVMMIRVADEKVAQEKLDQVLEFLSVQMKELATQNPMMAMMAIRTMPTSDESLKGFKDIYFGMTPTPFVCGVTKGHIVIGQSAHAATLCLATGADKHPNITKNSRLMSEAVKPDGDVASVSFTDQRQLGAQIGAILGGLSMGGQFAMMAIPDPNAQKVVGKVLGIVAKLGTVASKVDFYKSTASATSFDGLVWRTQAVTHYISPAERKRMASSESVENE